FTRRVCGVAGSASSQRVLAGNHWAGKSAQETAARHCLRTSERPSQVERQCASVGTAAPTTWRPESRIRSVVPWVARIIYFPVLLSDGPGEAVGAFSGRDATGDRKRLEVNDGDVAVRTHGNIGDGAVGSNENAGHAMSQADSLHFAARGGVDQDQVSVAQIGDENVHAVGRELEAVCELGVHIDGL